MRAALKSLDTGDSPNGDLDAFVPDDGEHFMLGVTASIGPPGERRQELFQFTVCSPSWLAAEPMPKGYAFLRHTLVIDRWSPELVHRAITELCQRFEGNDWPQLANQLSRYGHWEFEDYNA